MIHNKSFQTHSQEDHILLHVEYRNDEPQGRSSLKHSVHRPSIVDDILLQSFPLLLDKAADLRGENRLLLQVAGEHQALYQGLALVSHILPEAGHAWRQLEQLALINDEKARPDSAEHTISGNVVRRGDDQVELLKSGIFQKSNKNQRTYEYLVLLSKVHVLHIPCANSSEVEVGRKIAHEEKGFELGTQLAGLQLGQPLLLRVADLRQDGVYLRHRCAGIDHLKRGTFSLVLPSL